MHARSRRVGTENGDPELLEAVSDPHPWRLAIILTVLGWLLIPLGVVFIFSL